MDNEMCKQLHDRFVQGETLSEDELSLLQAWYKQQDDEEAAQINVAIQTTQVVSQLQEQITQTASQLQIITQHIASTISANETLRKEIAALQARLAQQASGRAA